MFPVPRTRHAIAIATEPEPPSAALLFRPELDKDVPVSVFTLDRESNSVRLNACFDGTCVFVRSLERPAAEPAPTPPNGAERLVTEADCASRTHSHHVA